MALYPTSNYPGGFRSGVTISNVPIEIMPEGKVWWVDSGAANNSNGSKAKPFATIATAITNASEYDTIMIAAGHSETLTSTSFVVDKALTIIGQGRGQRMPTFTTTSAAATGTVSITDADVTISNIRLVAGYTGGSAAAITIAAGGDFCTLDRIVCRDGSANTIEWLTHVSVATTVTDLTIQNCDFIGLISGSMTNSILFAGTTSNVRIINNLIDVDSSDSTIDHDAGKATSILVANNLILNQDTTATDKFCIELEATSTGHVAYNGLSYANAGATSVLGEAAFFIENYGGNTAGSSGELDPAAVAIP
jgi:hypothetical protein